MKLKPQSSPTVT